MIIRAHQEGISWDAYVSWSRAEVRLTLNSADVELEGDLTEALGRAV